MMTLVLSAVEGLLLLVLLGQDTEALVERLRSGSPAEREEAVAALKALGEKAEPALKRAAEDADVDVAGIARRLAARCAYERELPAALRAAFPGLADRLSTSEAAWTETLEQALLAAGTSDRLAREDVPPLIERGLAAAREPARRRKLYQELSVRGYREAIPALVRAALDDRDERMRESAQDALRNLKAEEAIPAFVARLDGADPLPAIQGLSRLSARRVGDPMVRLLEHPDGDVRDAVLFFLQSSGERRALPDELRRLLTAPSAQIRCRALAAAAHVDPPAAFEHAVPLLRDAEGSVRRHALAWVQAAGGPGALGPLRAACADGDSSVRYLALSGLLERRDPELPGLLARAAKDEDEGVRRLAARGFATHPGDPEPLLALLRDPDQDVAAAALQSCSRLGLAGAWTTLVERIEKAPPEERKRLAELVVSWNGDVTADLRKFLSHDDAWLRLMAMVGLALIEDPAGQTAVLEALKAPSWEIRGVAVEVASRLDLAGAGARITSLLADPDERVARDASSALYLLDPDPAELRRLTASELPDARRYAVEAMAMSDPEGALPFALRGLRDPESEVRVACVRTIVDLEQAGAAGEIAALLADPEGDVRGAAARALGALGGRDFEPALRNLLMDESAEARRNALDALRALGADRREDLLGLREDPDRYVRRAAIEWLARHSDPRDGEVLEAAIRDPDREVRAQAALALTHPGVEGARGQALRLLGDPEYSVRRAALVALETLGTGEDLATIVRTLRSGSVHDDLLVGVVRAVGAEGGAERIAALLESPLPSERDSAARVLGLLRQPGSLPALLRALETEDGRFRAQVVAALRRFPPSGLEETFRKALKDRHEAVRAEAAIALGNARVGAAWEDLRAAADDGDARVRRTALQAMARLRPEAVHDPAFLSRCEREESMLGQVLADSPIRSEAALAALRRWIPDERWGRDRTARAGLLCNQGSDEDVAWILMDGDSLDGLNSLRSPELWTKLVSTDWEGPDEIDAVDALPLLASKLGLRLQGVPGKRLSGLRFRGGDGPASLREVLDACVPGFWCAVDGELRLMTKKEALRFWRGWWAERKKQ